MKPEIELTVDELEERIVPTIVMVNGGGNTPQGEVALNLRAFEFENPTGVAPLGQNR